MSAWPRAAFDGLRVLDFSQGIAGPMACMLLADLGAEVVKVETPPGDRLRSHPGYLCWNRNKLRVELDLETQAGLRHARELLVSADVAVFDDPPTGLEARTVSAQQPGLLYATLPPYGHAQSDLHLPSDHALLAAASGTAFQQFSWEDVPVYLVTPQLSYAHALVAAAAHSGRHRRARSHRPRTGAHGERS